LTHTDLPSIIPPSKRHFPHILLLPTKAFHQVETGGNSSNFMSTEQISRMPTQVTSAVIWQITAASVSRLFLNTARRFPYPFAPALSRGLGVPLTGVTSVIAANQITGIAGPVFAPLGDRWGYQIMLLAGMGLLTVGMLMGGFFPLYVPVMGALFLAGLGKTVFDPAIQAYVGERIRYERRGMAVGLIETCWAGSTLVGIPLIGLLIDQWGWRAPFFVLGVLGLMSAVVLVVLMPADGQSSKASRASITVWSAWRRVSRERAGLSVLGFAFFASVANDNFFVVYGAWLEEAFHLSIVTLGVTTTVIGAAELVGEGLTASLADWVGLRRSVIIGLALSGVSYAVLPHAGQTLPMALVALFAVFLTFEFTIVTALSLSTELLPAARATMMSGFFAAAGAGRVVGTLIGGRIWMVGGIGVIGVVSASVSCLALASLVWGLRGWQPRTASEQAD
jgi:DHA1 family inner membrane transport protein